SSMGDDPPVQDGDRVVPAEGRGLRRDRGGERRARLLSRLGRPLAPLPREDPGALLREPAGAAADDGGWSLQRRRRGDRLAPLHHGGVRPMSGRSDAPAAATAPAPRFAAAVATPKVMKRELSWSERLFFLPLARSLAYTFSRMFQKDMTR